MAAMAILGTHLTGLTVVWSGALPVLGVIGFAIAAWAYLVNSRPNEIERRVAEALLALGLLLILGLTAPLCQYVALRLDRPLIDPWLSHVDALTGLSVKASAAWLQLHPKVNQVLALAYVSLLFQFALIVPLLAGIGRTDRLHEYLFHFHVCSLITVVCLALWPAAGVFQYEQFTATLPESRFIRHFGLLRAGTPPPLVFGEMEGMVSLPSFHFAGAWMITWALRLTSFFWPVFMLNALLTLGTFATGAHYVTDGFGTVAMGLASLALWRRVQRSALAAAPAEINVSRVALPRAR